MQVFDSEHLPTFVTDSSYLAAVILTYIASVMRVRSVPCVCVCTPGIYSMYTLCGYTRCLMAQ